LAEIYLIDQPNCEVIAKKTIPSSVFIGVNFEYLNLKLDKKFDIIICADVLEHLINPWPCLEFTYNHLSDNGIVIFSTPDRDILRGISCTTSPHNAHVREWNMDEFRKLLEFGHFNIINHKLIPPKRLSPVEDFLRYFLSKIFTVKRWSSCQIAVCSK
jgi:predicted TPR repeat methyltransferase